jgi:hypothetical protein
MDRRSILKLGASVAVAVPTIIVRIPMRSAVAQSDQGCCSHHGGEAQCVGTRLMCNDGQTSPTCSCRRYLRSALRARKRSAFDHASSRRSPERTTSHALRSIGAAATGRRSDETARAAAMIACQPSSSALVLRSYGLIPDDLAGQFLRFAVSCSNFARRNSSLSRERAFQSPPISRHSFIVASLSTIVL